ncbi:hypothetical protein EBH_0083050 [Eimeria brunetti]|uniref:Transmembrane protein n=1 Tax=Eimeria brunetti TaxID=51314 RepID=U6LGM3_9EIME|nr:hypothetical protein EBH_0083050 [Eimeria brunetti]
MFAAAAAEALVTTATDTAKVPSSQTAAVSTVTPHGESIGIDPFTSLNLVVGHSLASFESSVISRGTARFAITVALVMAACLGVAFAVLHCARKAGLPRFFGSSDKRALSNADLEEQRTGACVDGEKGESKKEAGDAGSSHEGSSADGTGESKALQALDELRCVLTLGLKAVPHLSNFSMKASLVLLLLTICAQEIALYGVYWTPSIELERQKTLDFVLQEGDQAVAQLYNSQEKSTAKGRAKQMLLLLEQFRDHVPWHPKQGELLVEARISAYRVSECKKALEQLQSWVTQSIPFPKKVITEVFRVVSFTRRTGRGRLKADDTADSWIEAVQARVGFYGIAQPNKKRKSSRHRLPFDDEMQILTTRYGKHHRALARCIGSVSSHEAVEHGQHVQDQQQEQKQEEDTKPLYQQQLPLTSQGLEHSAPPRSVLRPNEQMDTLRTGPASRSRTPRAPPPNWQKTQQETKDEQQTPLGHSKVKSVLRADAPVFTPREPPHTDAHKRMSPIPSGSRDNWPPVPPPRGSESRWGPADMTKPDGWWPTPHTPHFASPWTTASPLSFPPSMPPQRQHKDFESTLAGHTPVSDSRTALQQHPRFLHPLSGPSAGPRSRQPTEGPSLRLPRSSLPSPTPGIPEHVPTPLHQFSGCQQQRATSRREAPAAFGLPKDGGAIGGTYSEGWAETKRLNPILDLIAEAFPEAEGHWSAGAERRQEEKGWPRAPPSHALPHSGGSPPTLSGVYGSVTMPTRTTKASPDPAQTLQTREGPAWGLWEGNGDDSGQW